MTLYKAGMIVDGYWKLVEKSKIGNGRRYTFVLENEYNGKRISLGDKAFSQIAKGEKTVSGIIHHKIQSSFLYGNHTKGKTK